MKNIAICYSGQIRNFQKCFETHLKHIIAPNKCKVFIFAHFWEDKDLHGQNYWDQYSERSGYSKNNLLEFLSINPDCFLIEKPIQFNCNLTPDPRFPHPIQNTLSMFYSMSMVNKIKNNFAKMHGLNFDWTFRMRTDLFFFNDLVLSDLKNDALYINDQYIHMDYAINDLFSFSSDEIMNKYFSVYENLDLIMQNGSAINPECLLGFHVFSQNIPAVKIPLQNYKYKLFRDL
jgi:hypothetical protein